MRSWAAVLLGAGVLLLAGCSNNGSTASDATAGTTTSTAATSATSATSATLSTAAGPPGSSTAAPVTVRLSARGAARLSPGRPLFSGTVAALAGAGSGVLLQLLADGTSLWSTAPAPDTSVMPPRLRPSRVELRAPDGHDGLRLVRTVVAQGNHEEAVQVIAGDTDATRTAWLATPSTDLDHSSWIVRAAAPGGPVRTLADSDSLFRTRSLPPALDWPDVRIGASGSGAVAYWTAAVPDPAAKGYTTAILSRPLDASAPLRTVALGAFPRPVGTALLYVTQPEADGVGGPYAIHRLSGGHDVVLRRGSLSATQTVTSFVADAAAMAWTVSDTRGAPALITAVAGTRTTLITAGATQAVLSLSGTRLAWSEQGGQVGDQDVIDLADPHARVGLIARGGGCAQVSVAGNLASWATQRGADCVVAVARVTPPAG